MLDWQLAQLIITSLGAGLTARAISGITVQRAAQPRQTAVPSGAGLFYRQISSHPYGWPQNRDVVMPDQSIQSAVVQVQNTRFQIGAIMPESPATPMAMTSRDLATAASSILQTPSTIEYFVSNDASVLRIGDVSVSTFQSDQSQNMYWAAFDLIVTHKDAFTFEGVRIDNFVANFKRV